MVHLVDQRGRVGHFHIELKDVAMKILLFSNLTNCNKLSCKCCVIF